MDYFREYYGIGYAPNTLEANTLELLRAFGASNWETLLNEYVRRAPSLGALQIRERAMSMIPVTLPNGESILRSSGGQNKLIKKSRDRLVARNSDSSKPGE